MVDNTGLDALGFKLINNDKAFETYLSQAELEPTPDNIMSPQGQDIRAKAKRVTKARMGNYLNARLGIVIDGTGKQYDTLTNQANKLRELGYEVAMMFVNTDLDTALERNNQRPRRLPEELVTKLWKDVQMNIGKFHNFFGKNMFVVDNSEGSNTPGVLNSMYKRMSEFAKKEVLSPVAKRWIEKETQSRSR